TLQGIDLTRRLSAALPRLCLRPWRSPQFKIKRKINIKVEGNGQECPSHTSRGGNPSRGWWCSRRVWGPSTAQDVHFVGVVLRSG
ncbi:MAG: hypothetical protein WBQ85_06735, partial [Candidatus Sulfotelmatobacter sp.]